MDMHAAACIWRSENDFPELVLSFHYMGLKAQTQVFQIWQQMPLA